MRRHPQRPPPAPRAVARLKHCMAAASMDAPIAPDCGRAWRRVPLRRSSCAFHAPPWAFLHGLRATPPPAARPPPYSPLCDRRRPFRAETDTRNFLFFAQRLLARRHTGAYLPRARPRIVGKVRTSGHKCAAQAPSPKRNGQRPRAKTLGRWRSKSRLDAARQRCLFGVKATPLERVLPIVRAIGAALWPPCKGDADNPLSWKPAVGRLSAHGDSRPPLATERKAKISYFTYRAYARA